jgi:hypothetical protein
VDYRAEKQITEAVEKAQGIAEDIEQAPETILNNRQTMVAPDRSKINLRSGIGLKNSA